MALNTLIAKLDTKSRSTSTKVLFIPLESSFLHLTFFILAAEIYILAAKI